jgi:hypothetical protein
MKTASAFTAHLALPLIIRHITKLVLLLANGKCNSQSVIKDELYVWSYTVETELFCIFLTI